MNSQKPNNLPENGPAPTAENALRAETNELRRLIRRGNRRWKRVVLLEALGLAIAAPLGYLWVILVLDSFFYLSTAARVLAGLLFLGAVLWQGRRLWNSWRRARFSDDQVALAMEHNTPGGLENRLINSIQLASGGAMARGEVSTAVIRENCRQLRRHHVEQAAAFRPALLRIGLAAVAVMTGLAFRAIEPERFSVSAARILLPFANVAPLYRTRLTVEPGNTQALPGEDVRVEIGIEGRIPPSVQIVSRYEGEHVTESLPVPAGSNRVTHVFTNLRGPLNYAVRGGDYETPFYLIRVPVPSELERLRATYRFPEYTGLSERIQEGAEGDLQALFGTEVRLEVSLTHPAESAALVFSDPGNETGHEASGDALRRLELHPENDRLFSGTFTMERSGAYRLETRRKGQAPALGPLHTITVRPDQPPQLLLSGLRDRQEVPIESVLSLDLSASDDFGLTAVGLFVRPDNGEDAAWTALETWEVAPGKRDVARTLTLPAGALGAAEGDRIELAPRGRDTYPPREGAWHTGDRVRLLLGGASSRLQKQYERILEVEAGIEKLIQGTLELSDNVQQWIRKLDSGSNLRWDDRETLATLHAAIRKLAETQSDLRSQCAGFARTMPEEAGALKLSLGMLADTEMVRAIQMIERVPDREAPGEKRAALGEARLIQERTLRSLREIRAAFTTFRQDWELENMIPFTRMLAERQAAMAKESTGYAALSTTNREMIARLRTGAARRQNKVLELSGLAGKAFRGMAGRRERVGEILAEAFDAAASTLTSDSLQASMRKAAESLERGEWQPASRGQAEIAAELEAIYTRLRQAQADFARQMMEALRALAENHPEAQAEIDLLKKGYSKQLMHGADIETMADIVHMAETADELKKKFENQPDSKPSAEGELADYISTHVSGSLMPDAERDFSIMTLATSPGGQQELIPGFETEDTMDISVLQSYEDIVGPLLEEADDIRKEFDSIVNLLLGQDIEAGAPGKGGLGMASVSAAAPTGNQKPDTHEHGGASRIGRQGARAHGIAVGSESISRRGRDQAQEGSQEVPDVDAAPLRETLSNDPAPDHSTGVGGREIEGEMQRTFSVQDAGEWDDSMAERMKDPQSAHKIVERAGAPFDPEVADRLRAMESRQEQLIERIKRVKKELDNLYLPTDHLDEAMRDLRANLERLRESPDPEAFKTQMESIDKLIGAVMVFDRPASEFQPSLPRQEMLRGEILDEPPGPTMPGYEKAVKRYYERLSSP